MKKTWFALSAVLALAACDRASDPLVCPAYIAPSVNVTVQDSVTGANLTAGSTLVLRNAAGVVDSMTIEPQPYTIVGWGLGMGAAGTFSLTVRHAGYREWTKAAIKVKQGVCGAETVNLTARLQPAP